jgi:hypothetical protein
MLISSDRILEVFLVLKKKTNQNPLLKPNLV